jgi:hypothetical protein
VCERERGEREKERENEIRASRMQNILLSQKNRKKWNIEIPLSTRDRKETEKK